MGTLDYILGYRKTIILREKVQPVVHNLKNIKVHFQDFVCNLHHINEPLVA